jgi:hypothetical protein
MVAYSVSHFDEEHAYGFDSGSLVKLDSQTGKVVNSFPIFDKAEIRLWNDSVKHYERKSPISC